MTKLQLFEEEFNKRYTNLLSKGYTINSPEMIRLFAYRTEMLLKISQENQQKNNSVYIDNSLSKSTVKNNSSKAKAHIIIDKFGLYYLLDSNFNVIETVITNSLFDLFFKSYNLRKFKKQLTNDLMIYKKKCKLANIRPNHHFLKMHRDIKFYLNICPDADYHILEFIRKHITELDSNYSNYQTACAEYLRELAKLYDGNPDILPFDINYATSDNNMCKDHKYISNTFVSFSNNPVEDFISIRKFPQNIRENYLVSHRLTIPEPNPVSNYTSQRKLHTSLCIDNER